MSTTATADPFQDVTPVVRQRILRAAVAAFGKSGYHATRTRDISAGAGISPSGMYVHFSSKDEVLFEIARLGHHSTESIVTEAMAAAATPAARIAATVARLTAWHAHNTAVAHVITTQMEALAPSELEEIMQIRRRTHRLLQGAVDDGVAAGQFNVPDTFSATMAIVSLFTDISRWYSPRAPRKADELAPEYASYALALLRYDGPGPDL